MSRLEITKMQRFIGYPRVYVGSEDYANASSVAHEEV